MYCQQCGGRDCGTMCRRAGVFVSPSTPSSGVLLAGVPELTAAVLCLANEIRSLRAAMHGEGSKT